MCENCQKAEADLRALEDVVCLTEDPRKWMVEGGAAIRPISTEKVGRLIADRDRPREALRKIAVPLIKHDGDCFAAAGIAAAALAEKP